MKHIYKLSDRYSGLTLIALFLAMLTLGSCQDFVEIDPPNDQITGKTVFKDAATVNAAMVNIYIQLRDNALTTGGTSGLGYLLGHYTDELTLYSTSLQQVQFFHENTILASNSSILNLWNKSYNLIYAANNIIEGVQNSKALQKEDKDRFLGEAYFIRAFIHFYLVNLYGDIPYIDSTSYTKNSTAVKLSVAKVYQKLVKDLIKSKSLLPIAYNGTNKARPNKWVATALLSRVFLYNQKWELALAQATEVISSGAYILNTDISKVFLKNSSETLWQYDPGITGGNTHEAQTYIFTSGPPPNSALSSHIINSFEAGDTRFITWTGKISKGSDTWYYPFKYKQNINTGTTKECSIVFRLSELYLIAAECNAHLGNTSKAISRLNSIRSRANLAPVSFANNTALLNAIYKERRIEFFTEHAHRFFDLKRTSRANSQLTPIKPNWKTIHNLLPIPENELLLNPNLKPQNNGY